jgi:hypothetical protein
MQLSSSNSHYSNIKNFGVTTQPLHVGLIESIIHNIL